MEDPFPTTVLEAMSAGKPVIGTRTGGIPEMITHGLTGFLIPPKSPEELAFHIRLLLNRADLIRTLGDDGRSRFEERFTIERFMHRFRTAILGGFDGTIESAP
jgi:glycosyltransferase involved in cell wall biosynthesis